MGFKVGARLDVAVAAMLIVLVSACSAEQSGHAEATSQAVPSDSSSSIPATDASPSSRVSLSIDPCELLSEEDLAEVGKFDTKYREGGGARSCYWRHSFENGGDGFTFVVSVRDAQSIETVVDGGGGVHRDEVNQRPSAWTVDPQFDDCTFAMKIDEMSRVDVSVAGDSESNDSCEVAKVIAGMIEPNLPEIP
jgi:hypothetical protein